MGRRGMHVGFWWESQKERVHREDLRAGLSNAAPVIYFPGALIYSASFNVNQNFKKKKYF
jgi:hypothetical protein